MLPNWKDVSYAIQSGMVYGRAKHFCCERIYHYDQLFSVENCVITVIVVMLCKRRRIEGYAELYDAHAKVSSF